MNVPVDCVGAVQVGVGLLTPPKVSCSASRIQQVPGPCMESGVGIPTPLQESATHASSPVCTEDLTLPQQPQISVSPQNPVSVAFSPDFTRNSKKCSPDELTVSELRGSGLTPHKKSTGFLASLSRDTSEIPVWAGRTLKVLSVFSGQEHAPKLHEGASASSWVPSCANQRSGCYSLSA